MSSADLAMALDPVVMSRRIGIEPDPWQQDVLRSVDESLLLLVCRQGGKSQTVSTLGLHTAFYQPESLTLVLSPSLRQSKEFFAKCLKSYRLLGRPIDPEAENKLELELANGSRIVALPGKEGTVRGFSGVDLLIIDEAARVVDELYRAVRPMLAVSGGRLAALTTPWGKRGWFHEEWEDGGDEWTRVQITAAECPRITPAFLEKERRALGPLWFKSEYLCEFVDPVDAVFHSEDIGAAIRHDITPLFATGG